MKNNYLLEEIFIFLMFIIGLLFYFISVFTYSRLHSALAALIIGITSLYVYYSADDDDKKLTKYWCSEILGYLCLASLFLFFFPSLDNIFVRLFIYIGGIIAFLIRKYKTKNYFKKQVDKPSNRF